MQKYYLKLDCPRCGGAGEYVHAGEEGDVMLPCEACDGKGVFVVGTVDGVEDIRWIKKHLKKIMTELGIAYDDE